MQEVNIQTRSPPPPWLAPGWGSFEEEIANLSVSFVFFFFFFPSEDTLDIYYMHMYSRYIL